MLNRITYTRKDNAYLFIRTVLGIIFLTEGTELCLSALSLAKNSSGEVWNGDAILVYSFGVIEIIGGIKLLAGFFSRIAATVLMLFIMASLFQFKYPVLLESGFIIFIMKSSKELLLVSSCILLVLKGSGNRSLDGWIYKKYYKTRYYGS